MESIILTLLFLHPTLSLFISGVFFFISSLVYGQKSDSTKTTSPLPEQGPKRPVKVSLLTNYYEQDGDRSAINGGLGSQLLHSYAGEASIYFPVNDSSGARIGGGVDYFTSASLQQIDKGGDGKGVSGDETRKYIHAGYDFGLKKGLLLSLNAGSSAEYDVTSWNTGVSFLKPLKKWNGKYSASFSYIVDRWMLVFPGEFRPTVTDAHTSASSNTSPTAAVPFTYTGKGIEKDGRTYPIDWRQSYALSNNYSFAINQHLNAGLGVDLLLQEGLLSSPFNRVYFDDGVSDENNKEVRVESLPRERMKIALSGRFNWFIHPLLILRTQARYYRDSWGIQANTYTIEASVKATKFLSFTSFYRLHVQQGSTYYRAYGHHIYTPGSYYTSDIDLGEFTAHKYGLSIRYVHFAKHASMLTLKDLSLRYARYNRQDGLYANIVSFELNFDISYK